LPILFARHPAGTSTRSPGSMFTLDPTALSPDRPEPPPILVGTAGPVTARRAGRHAQGIITMGGSDRKIATLFERVRTGAREAGKDPDSMHRVIQLHTAWAPTDAEAVETVLQQWPNGAMRFPTADLRSPFEVAQIARLLRSEAVHSAMVVSADPADHLREIQRYVDLGATAIYLHDAGTLDSRWVEVFGTEVLPKVVH